jgi:prenylated cyclic peptide (anacyclamide/piricyclamide family)
MTKKNLKPKQAAPVQRRIIASSSLNGGGIEAQRPLTEGEADLNKWLAMIDSWGL